MPQVVFRNDSVSTLKLTLTCQNMGHHFNKSIEALSWNCILGTVSEVDMYTYNVQPGIHLTTVEGKIGCINQHLTV